MLSKNANEKTFEARHQMQIIALDELVPEDHLLRQIDKQIDFTFIYELVEPLYSPDVGRPSVDPVTLIKIPIIQYLFGIPSMRQTIAAVQVNVAYRWFLGLSLTDPVPHFSTFGKNYTRRFEGTDLFEQIFQRILQQCVDYQLVDTASIFVDGTHVKACANGRNYENKVVAKEAKWLADELEQAIQMDREAHGKKPLKPQKKEENTKNQKVSKHDPESGWFHKGDHKQVFAYNVQTACDKYGWILGYSVQAGNTHDTQAFPAIYDKIRDYQPQFLIADAGYKTPTIAHYLFGQSITPVFPYTRPRKKPENRDVVYDEYYDCYIDGEGRIYEYSTTNRKGYREYKAKSVSDQTPTNRVITRHVWQADLEECEHIRHTEGMKELYQTRKESIERQFGTAKEHHGMRYTHLVGLEKMRFKVGLTFTCLNMKKLTKLLSY